MAAGDLFAAAPELMKKGATASVAIASSLDPTLVGLVEIRASQINGCLCQDRRPLIDRDA